ncbi:MAG TPA: fumarate reductase subunit C [Rhodothermia bacterium]
MAHRSKYTSPRSRRYVKRVPIFWWVRKWSYTKFILRELSSVSVAAYAVVLILLVQVVGAGPAQYQEFMELFESPVSIGLNIVALAFVLLHSVTWFNLAPKALVIRVGNKVVPPMLIVGMNYAAWIVVSAAVVWILLEP